MAPRAREQGFSRRHRFCAQGAYGAALQSRRKARGDLVTLHVVASSTGTSRLGVALSRRLVPSSVERNRMKRLVREAFRRHAVKGSGLDVVVTLRGKTMGPLIDRAAAEAASLLDRFATPA